MKTVSFHPENFAFIKQHIEKHLPVIIPTDTCYGFSGSIFSFPAIKRVEQIKGREEKPFLVLVENEIQLKKYGVFSKDTLPDVQKPTSFLLPKTSHIPHHYFPETSEIGIRIPSSFLPLISFLHFLQYPIFSTSANKTKKPSIYTEAQIIHEFSCFPDILFASLGDLPTTAASSIIRLLPNGEQEVIRE